MPNRKVVEHFCRLSVDQHAWPWDIFCCHSDGTLYESTIVSLLFKLFFLAYWYLMFTSHNHWFSQPVTPKNLQVTEKWVMFSRASIYAILQPRFCRYRRKVYAIRNSANSTYSLRRMTFCNILFIFMHSEHVSNINHSIKGLRNVSGLQRKTAVRVTHSAIRSSSQVAYIRYTTLKRIIRRYERVYDDHT